MARDYERVVAIETLQKMRDVLARQFDAASERVDPEISKYSGLLYPQDEKYDEAVKTVTQVANAYVNVVSTLEKMHP